jgi:hypothetical protein
MDNIEIEKQLDESLDRNIELVRVYKMLLDCRDLRIKEKDIIINKLRKEIELIEYKENNKFY